MSFLFVTQIIGMCFFACDIFRKRERDKETYPYGKQRNLLYRDTEKWGFELLLKIIYDKHTNSSLSL